MSHDSQATWAVQQRQHSQQSYPSKLRQPMPTETTKDSVSDTELSDTTDALIESAIRSTLPAGPGERNRAVFALARALKAIPHFADAPSVCLHDIVERWHALALPVINTKPFEETWIDFARGWARVIYPAGGGPLDLALERAEAVDPPAEAMRYEQPALRLLASLCRELQRNAGEGPFFLSCRTAARMLGVDHTTAWRWLFLLGHDGLLRVVEAGTKTKAARYRYTASLDGPQTKDRVQELLDQCKSIG